MPSKFEIWSVQCVLLYMICTRSAEDPCSPGEHNENITHAVGRSTNCPFIEDNHCDNYLSPGWYKVDASTPMPNTCVPWNNCGTRFPIWMNGSVPTVDDGEVVRTACVTVYDVCCDTEIGIKLKNCTSFLVYYLETAPFCPTKYCFGSSRICDENDIPVATTRTTQETTTVTECLDWTFGNNCEGICNCEESNTERCSKDTGSCSCKDAWTGSRCQKDRNECVDEPCNTNQQCVNTVGSFICGCLPGYSDNGQGCEECPDWTFGNNCEGICNCEESNTERCSKDTGSCSCKDAWTGSRCQKDRNECVDEPCSATQQCINTDGSFICECQPGYSDNGQECEVCAEGTFQYECLGVCQCTMANTEQCNTTNGKCSCKHGWKGSRCQRPAH